MSPVLVYIEEMHLDGRLLRLLGEEDRLDARNDSSSSDGDSRHQLVDLVMTMAM